MCVEITIRRFCQLELAATLPTGDGSTEMFIFNGIELRFIGCLEDMWNAYPLVIVILL